MLVVFWFLLVVIDEIWVVQFGFGGCGGGVVMVVVDLGRGCGLKREREGERDRETERVINKLIVFNYVVKNKSIDVGWVVKW